MKIFPIDFNKTIKEILEWLDAWRVERFGSDSLNPERYYNVNGRYLYGVKEGESLNEEKAIFEKVQKSILQLKDINDKLAGRNISQHLQWEEREILKRQREKVYKVYQELVQQKPQRVVPDELATDEAKKYFEKAIDMGLMDADYNWQKGLQMLACFAREMSLKLQLGKGVNSDGSPRISWQPFETLFNLKKGKLRSNYNDIQKTGQSPSEIGLIDKVFE